jgi:hypothetical protein
MEKGKRALAAKLDDQLVTIMELIRLLIPFKEATLILEVIAFVM